jgi:hypothetical protein
MAEQALRMRSLEVSQRIFWRANLLTYSLRKHFPALRWIKEVACEELLSTSPPRGLTV